VLTDRVILITGASRGIGAATARLCAAQGAKLVLTGFRHGEQLDSLAAELRAAHGGDVLTALYDVADSAAVRGVFQTIFKTHGRLDGLVNNAGMLDDALIGMIARPVTDTVLAVNVAAVIEHIQGAARLMGRRKAGTIVNLASIIGVHGNAGQMVYGASKAAVIGATLSAAKELAPLGIRVNAVAPGFIDTDMTRSLPEETRAKRLASIGLGRAGQPEDVAKVITFLLGDLSAYVTGQVIGVDGGMVI